MKIMKKNNNNNKKKTLVAVPLQWFMSGSCPSKQPNLVCLLPGLLLPLSGPFNVEIRKAIDRWDGNFYFTNNKHGTFTRG